MKINFKKYQNGGLIASIYQPVTVTESVSPRAQMAINFLNNRGVTASASATSSGSSSKGDLTEKGLYDLYSMLKDGGLQNDVQSIIGQLRRDIFNDQLLDPLGTTSDLSNKYLRAIQYVNQAKQNEKSFDEAYNIAKDNKALNEAAISTDGKVVVLKNGNLTSVSIEEYKRNPNSYQLQTNASLLEARRNSPQLAFNNTIFDIVKNGTSVDQVMATVQQFITGLGNNEDALPGYTRKETDDIRGGLAVLQAAAAKYGPKAVESVFEENGLYKVGITNTEQVKQAQMALTALLTMIPENQKALLKLKSNGTDEGVAELLSILVNKNNKNKFTFTADLQKEKDDSSSSSSSSSSGGTDKIKLGPEESYYLGLGDKKNITFQNGTTNAFTAINTVSRQLTDNQGKPVGVTTANALTKSSYSNQFEPDQITMGGQRIQEEALFNIQIDGTITSAVLPIDKKALNEDNLFKPDFEHLKKLEQINKLVSKSDLSIIENANAKIQHGQKLSTQEQTNLKGAVERVNKVYKDNGLDQVYDQNGNLTSAYHRFSMVNAKAPESVFAPGTDWKQTHMNEITDQNQIDNILNVINKGRTKENQFDFNKKGLFGADGVWFLDYDRMFEGVMFIPMKNSFINAYTDTLNPTQANAIDAQEQFNVRLQGGFKE